MDDESKTRRINNPGGDFSIEMDQASTPDESEAKVRRVEDDMIDSMNEVDRKIMVAVILGVDITEVYSPERVAQVAKRYGLVAGSSFDLTNGWDFNLKEHREEARRRIKIECPYLLIGSPPCTYFSMLQELDVAVHGHKP